jgi:hypothetical protein
VIKNTYLLAAFGSIEMIKRIVQMSSKMFEAQSLDGNHQHFDAHVQRMGRMTGDKVLTVEIQLPQHFWRVFLGDWVDELKAHNGVGKVSGETSKSENHTNFEKFNGSTLTCVSTHCSGSCRPTTAGSATTARSVLADTD